MAALFAWRVFEAGQKNSQRFANAKIRSEGPVTRDNFPRNNCCEKNRLNKSFRVTSALNACTGVFVWANCYGHHD